MIELSLKDSLRKSLGVIAFLSSLELRIIWGKLLGACKTVKSLPLSFFYLIIWFATSSLKLYFSLLSYFLGDNLGDNFYDLFNWISL